MKRTTLFTSIMTLLLAATITFAQSGFELSWDGTASGGGASSGGPYTLSDTLGQPAVGTSASADGRFSVVDGFQVIGGVDSIPTPPSSDEKVYLPSMLRSD